MPAVSSSLTLSALADSIAHMAAACGFADEAPRDLLLLLCEETGELARAIRLAEGLAVAADTSSASLPAELADCAILLVRLALAYRVDLGAAVLAKCAQNERRYG